LISLGMSVRVPLPLISKQGVELDVLHALETS
jgi:hypothetical protein